MDFKNYFSNLKSHQKALILIAGSVAVLSLGLTLAQPLEYRSSCQLLIIQKNNPNLDAYAAARSAESLSENLSKIIYTSSFFNKIMASGFDLKNNFSKDEARRRTQWKRKVEAQISRETGMLKINVYDKDKASAKEFSRAIAYVLSTKGEEYHGGGENVEIKLVDTPLTSRFPVRPNFFLNIFTGLILGVIAGGGYLAINPKSQALNSKQIQNSKFQIQNHRLESGIKNYESGIKNQELEKKIYTCSPEKSSFSPRSPQASSSSCSPQASSSSCSPEASPSSCSPEASPPRGIQENIKTEEPNQPLVTNNQLPEIAKIFTMYDHLSQVVAS